MKKNKFILFFLLILSIFLVFTFLTVARQTDSLGVFFHKSEKTATRWKNRFFDFIVNVDDHVLLLGDSHLAIHPWNDYIGTKSYNRAVSGFLIRNVNIDKFKGTPAAVVLSIGTNDIQFGRQQDRTVRELKRLFQDIQNKWPKSVFIYVSPPPPDVNLYEKFIRPKFPQITRPTPSALNALEACAKAEGFHVLHAKSAGIDGLHIDPDSAKEIGRRIDELLEE